MDLFGRAIMERGGASTVVLHVLRAHTYKPILRGYGQIVTVNAIMKTHTSSKNLRRKQI